LSGVILAVSFAAAADLRAGATAMALP